MITSKNPYTGKEIRAYKEFDDQQIEALLDAAQQRFHSWKSENISRRAELMKIVSETLLKNKEKYAGKITEEMGKPISQSVSEIEKCAWVCEYYAENAETFLKEEIIETDASISYVHFDPIGVVLGVMPWNFPFWQVFRFAVPTLMAGNVVVLKHASNVMGCAFLIEEVFLEAGFPEGCFQNLCIGSKKVEKVIQDKRIMAVSLTGSKPAGSAVASTAGKEIKKTLLELGGSNALVVFEDANIEESIKTCVEGRYLNTGQSCIAGKRLLLHESIEKEFMEKFVQAVKQLKSGNPTDEDTYIGVMAREDLAESLEKQVKESVGQGAKLLLGGNRKNAYFEPTILTNVIPEMPVFKEETFGPAIAVLTFKEEEEAIELVNRSEFGLGVSIFTEDLDRAAAMAKKFEDGAVFVNSQVKSDPRIPFGGTKTSGYGRELSKHGIMEFINKKTVYINKY